MINKYIMGKNSENTVKAENQVQSNENIFYIGNTGLRVLILGNSITRHGICPEIGWYGLYGMAASRIENDYVHVLYRRISGKVDAEFMVCQLADWERTYKNYDLNNLSEMKKFDADFIIFRLGENVGEVSYEEQNVFSEKLEILIDYLKNKDNRVVFTTCFWENAEIDDAIKKVCGKTGGLLVELGDLGKDPTMKAIGLFEHSGVAAHPGDKGMEAIAERIFDKIKKFI